MVVLGMLFTSLFVFAVESQQQQAAVNAIQDKFEYRNFFDTCINNRVVFEALRDQDNVDVYNNYLNAGSALLKKSFKEFIERHKSEAIDYTRFRRLKGLAFAYSLVYTPDISLIPLLENNHFDNFFFSKAFQEAVKKEHTFMLTKLDEFPVISKIFMNEIFKLQKNYRDKDRKNENFSKDIKKPLRRFCKYAYIMNTCYFIVA
jgi:hypothetical protein